MKKTLIAALMTMGTMTAIAQSKLTKENVQKDSTIKVDVIDPAIRDAQGEAPDWVSLSTAITKKYDATYADRNITKNKIFFYYGKDWSTFTAALVKYTVQFEDPENLKLMNKNAKMVAQYSTDKSELQTALGWSKHSVDKEPTNADYKQTFNALTTKIAAQ